jgi:hypothetical protein
VNCDAFCVFTFPDDDSDNCAAEISDGLLVEVSCLWSGNSHFNRCLVLAMMADIGLLERDQISQNT